MIIVLFTLLMNFFFVTPTPETEMETGTVTITFTNVELNKGVVRSALYVKEGFLKRDGELYDSKEKTTSSTITVTYNNIPYGTYAIASYQDANEDAKLSSNAIGVPNEAYGFSKPLQSKWSVPKFEDVSFVLDSSSENFNIELNYWRNH
jgi:uncharacterized protein (DUF2141 family)